MHLRGAPAFVSGALEVAEAPVTQAPFTCVFPAATRPSAPPPSLWQYPSSLAHHAPTRINHGHKTAHAGNNSNYGSVLLQSSYPHAERHWSVCPTDPHGALPTTSVRIHLMDLNQFL